MDYNLDTDSQRKIVTAQAHGVISAEGLAKIRTDIASRLSEGNCRDYVLDLRDGHLDMTTTQLYRFGSTFAEAGIPRDARFAVVVAPEDVDNQFIVTVASNRGFHTRYFTGMTEALDWVGKIRSAPMPVS